MKKPILFCLFLFMYFNQAWGQEEKNKYLKGYISGGFGSANGNFSYHLALKGRYKNVVVYVPYVQSILYRFDNDDIDYTSTGLEGGYVLNKKTFQFMVTTGIRHVNIVTTSHSQVWVTNPGRRAVSGYR